MFGNHIFQHSYSKHISVTFFVKGGAHISIFALAVIISKLDAQLYVIKEEMEILACV